MGGTGRGGGRICEGGWAHCVHCSADESATHIYICKGKRAETLAHAASCLLAAYRHALEIPSKEFNDACCALDPKGLHWLCMNKIGTVVPAQNYAVSVQDHRRSRSRLVASVCRCFPLYLAGGWGPGRRVGLAMGL